MRKDLKHIVITWYCIIFYLLLLYKWMNGMLLYQLQPSFFYNRFDLLTWYFMKTGIHQWLLNNPIGWALFDIVFYTAPLLLLLISSKAKRWLKPAAIVLLLINWIYVQCYTLYPSNSIEGHLAWLLFPIAFIPSNPKTFNLLLKGLRYFFLFFFASAGVWKIIQGGVFNINQMSGVLLMQHQELLTNSDNLQTHILTWLIQHPGIGYSLYLGATIIELVFIIGFFTRKYDRWLIALFILFLIADQLIMRIGYYEVTPFLIPLWIGSSKKHLRRV